jgi:CRP/FNR family cyclic AMP-dependent transcriptional regulator
MRRDRRGKEHRIESWRAVPLLAGCTRRQLELVDGLGTQLDIRAGRTLTLEGTPGRECFVVLAGAASAERGDTPVGTVAGGTVAGELALLDGTTRRATVVAATPMRVVVLTPTEFSELLEVAPCVQDRVLETAERRRLALEEAAAR